MFKIIANKYLFLEAPRSTTNVSKFGLFLINEIMPSLGGYGDNALLRQNANSIDLEVTWSGSNCMEFSTTKVTLPPPHHERVRFYIQEIFEGGASQRVLSSGSLTPDDYEPSIFAPSLVDTDRRPFNNDIGQQIFNEKSALNNLSAVLKLIQQLLGSSSPKSKLAQLVLAECFITKIKEVGGQKLNELAKASRLNSDDFYKKYCSDLLNSILDSNFTLTIILPRETQEIDTNTKVRDLEDMIINLWETQSYGFDPQQTVLGKININERTFNLGDVLGEESSSDYIQTLLLNQTLGEESKTDGSLVLDDYDDSFGFSTTDETTRNDDWEVTLLAGDSVNNALGPVLQLLPLDSQLVKAQTFLDSVFEDSSKNSLQSLLSQIEQQLGETAGESIVDDGLLEDVDLGVFQSKEELTVLWVRDVINKLLMNEKEGLIKFLTENPHKLHVHKLIHKLRYAGLQEVVDDITSLLERTPRSPEKRSEIERDLKALIEEGKEKVLEEQGREPQNNSGIVIATWNQSLPKLYQKWMKYSTMSIENLSFNGT